MTIISKTLDIKDNEGTTQSTPIWEFSGAVTNSEWETALSGKKDSAGNYLLDRFILFTATADLSDWDGYYTILKADCGFLYKIDYAVGSNSGLVTTSTIDFTKCVIKNKLIISTEGFANIQRFFNTRKYDGTDASRVPLNQEAIRFENVVFINNYEGGNKGFWILQPNNCTFRLSPHSNSATNNKVFFGYNTDTAANNLFVNPVFGSGDAGYDATISTARRWDIEAAKIEAQGGEKLFLIGCNINLTDTTRQWDLYLGNEDSSAFVFVAGTKEQREQVFKPTETKIKFANGGGNPQTRRFYGASLIRLNVVGATSGRIYSYDSRGDTAQINKVIYKKEAIDNRSISSNTYIDISNNGLVEFFATFNLFDTGDFANENSSTDTIHTYTNQEYIIRSFGLLIYKSTVNATSSATDISLYNSLILETPTYLTHTQTEITAYLTLETLSQLSERIYLFAIQQESRGNPQDEQFFKVVNEFLEFSSDLVINNTSGDLISYTADTITLNTKNAILAQNSGLQGIKTTGSLTINGVATDFIYQYVNASNQTITNHIFNFTTTTSGLPYLVDIQGVLLSDTSVVNLQTLELVGSQTRQLEIIRELYSQIIIYIYGSGADEKTVTADIDDFNFTNNFEVVEEGNPDSQWISDYNNGISVSLVNNNSKITINGTWTNLSLDQLIWAIRQAISLINKSQISTRLLEEDFVNHTGNSVIFLKVFTNTNFPVLTSTNTNILITFNNDNVDYLFQTIGISAETSSAATYIINNLKSGDKLYVQTNELTSTLVNHSITTTSYTLSLTKGVIYQCRIYRVGSDSPLFILNDDTRTGNPLFLDVGNLDYGEATGRTISDYATFNNNKIQILKDFVDTSDLYADKYLEEIDFWFEVNQLAPFGITAKHLLDDIIDGIVEVNYELESNSSQLLANQYVSILVNNTKVRPPSTIAFLPSSRSVVQGGFSMSDRSALKIINDNVKDASLLIPASREV